MIVVDDTSCDETMVQLATIQGLTLLRNDAKLGLIESSNRGAAFGRGEYLVFLDNNAVVTEGWLEALERTFRAIPGTGLAGAKLIYPNGRLQEAGSVIWRDASGWSYGRFDDAGHPSYNFTREVDYCSRVCLMVRRALFRELGGFDSHYSPVHYEDTDLAFKIRHAGHKVVYQPLARIVNHQRQTSVKSLGSGAKSYRLVNQERFRQRWKDRLEAHHPEPPHLADRNDYARREDLAARGHVLVVDAHILMPDQDCGSLRMMEVVRAIRGRGHHVSFIPDHPGPLGRYLEELQCIGVEVIVPPHYGSLEEFLKERGRQFDLAILSRANVAATHMTAVRRFAPQAKVVFDTVDLHFLREERQAHVTQDEGLLAEISNRKQSELKLVGRADCTLVVSPIEKEILAEECPDCDVRVLPTIYPIDERDRPGYEDRRDIIFIGNFRHMPNVDAILHFIREIFPRIHERLPEATLNVIGPHPAPEIVECAGPSIRILGHVPDVEPIFDRARVSVAPIRFGAGVKGKINQSMALGVPVVASSIAAEGMYLVHEHSAIIADDPESFVDAVIRLWTLRELWQRVAANGRRNLRDHFSVEAAKKPIDELLEWAGLPSAVRRVGRL